MSEPDIYWRWDLIVFFCVFMAPSKLVPNRLKKTFRTIKVVQIDMDVFFRYLDAEFIFFPLI